MSLSRKYYESIQEPPTQTYYKLQIIFQSTTSSMGSRKKIKKTTQQTNLKKWCEQILYDSIGKQCGEIQNQYETIYVCEEQSMNIENGIEKQWGVFHSQNDQIQQQWGRRCTIMDFEWEELKFEPFNFMKTQQQLSNIQY